MSEIGEFVAIARRAAALAGEVIMPLYEAGVTVELKADRTPVTKADRDAEAAIRQFLAAECPGHGILGEEFGETPGEGRFRWVLDPIDGTKSFIHHVPLFGTLVALERDGLPVVGIIACHAAGETAWAGEGEGAFLNGRPIRVSATAKLEEATVLLTSFQRMPRYHGGAFAALTDRAGLMRTWGDCYGYLAVAAGRADAMLDPIVNPWDVAALYPIVTEAGGRITQWSGRGEPGDSAVASNAHLHEELLAILQGGRTVPGA